MTSGLSDWSQSRPISQQRQTCSRDSENSLHSYAGRGRRRRIGIKGRTPCSWAADARTRLVVEENGSDIGKLFPYAFGLRLFRKMSANNRNDQLPSWILPHNTKRLSRTEYRPPCASIAKTIRPWITIPSSPYVKHWKTLESGVYSWSDLFDDNITIITNNIQGFHHLGPNPYV